MTLEAQFNALNGKKVSRQILEKLLTDAKKQKKSAIVRRVSLLLSAYQDTAFKIEIKKPIKTPDKSPVQKKPARKIKPVQSSEVKKKTTVVDHRRNTLSALLASEKKSQKERKYFKFKNPELAKFMGNIEVKPVESVVVTLAAPKGAGKTTFLMKLLDDLAQNHLTGFASMEIHPKSGLYQDMATEHQSRKAIDEIECPEVKTYSDFEILVANNEVIAVDSFGKLKKLQKSLELDEDLRKKYNGKLFILIYQLTTNKTMRGGSDSEFDGDINLFIEKKDIFSQNYVWTDKNRYTKTDISELKYNFNTGKLIKPQSEKKTPEQPGAKPKLSFKVSSL